jgi:hypothetical protein
VASCQEVGCDYDEIEKTVVYPHADQLTPFHLLGKHLIPAVDEL